MYKYRKTTLKLLKIIFLIILFANLPGAHSEPLPLDRNISLNFNNTDIDLVLKFFSDVMGIIFIKSDLVRGFVTILAPQQVTTTEAMQILQTVLELKGFTLVPGPGKVFKVMAQAEAAQNTVEVNQKMGAFSLMEGDRMISQVVPLNFMSAMEVKTELSPLLTKSGSLVTDERTNTLVITDMMTNIRRLIKIIETIDIRSPQVLIEALIMEVSLTNETKLGFEWSYKGNMDSRGHNLATEAEQAFSLGSLVTEGLKYSIIRSDQNLKGLFQLLATDKNVNILSTPHIMTVNNQPATIRVGEEVPVLTQTRNIQGGETIRSFDFKSVAIELEVTPRINNNREVFLKVHPLVKKILGFNSELNAPILATREAQTSVLVKDGNTVVIGGLMKDDRSTNQSKIPILGDIPILGYFFKKQSVTKEKTELLVFITPRVIENPDEARDLTIKKESESKSKETPHRWEAKTHFRLGKMHLKYKRYDEALQEWQKVLLGSPDEKLKKQTQKLIDRVNRLKNR